MKYKNGNKNKSGNKKKEIIGLLIYATSNSLQNPSKKMQTTERFI